MLGARFDIEPAGVVERAIDLHLHDLEPRRKQTLRLLVGLEHDLQQTGQALPRLDARSHQIFKLRQVGSQRRDQRLDGDSRFAGRAGARGLVQCGDKAVGFRPHPLRCFVAFLRRRGGEQGGSRSDQPVGCARDFERADHLRHAGIDQFEAIADLAKGVDAGGGGEHGEGADPEEREQ